MSPRFTSSSTSAPAARDSAITRSSTAMPRLPNRSKNADCGLTTATYGATASTAVSANRSSPATSSVRPHSCSSAACGSIPTQNGPRSARAACEAGAEGASSSRLLLQDPAAATAAPRR